MLDDVRVLDLTDERGMFCGQLLADLGADVIAVEPPGGSPARRLGPFAGGAADPEKSLTWWAYARNKRSVTLDLDDAGGRGRFRRLVASAHLVIESFQPGHLAERGLGYEDLAAVNPRLSLISITPFGQDGPKARWAANALTALAASGVLHLTGDDDRAPLQVPGNQAYLHAGADAAVAALIALEAAERDGVGQHADISMQVATMMATQSVILAHGWDPGTPGQRVAGGATARPVHIHFVYPASDGHVSVTFLFGNMIGPFTRRLFDWMYEEGAVDAATRDKDWVAYGELLLTGAEPLSELERCTQCIREFTRKHTKQELFTEALRRRLLVVPVSTVADVSASEQLADRGYWCSVATPDRGAPVRYPGPFCRFGASPITYRRPAPTIGEHNAEVLDAVSTEPLPSTADQPPSPPPARPALEGIKVLDLSWVIATPFGVRYLADWGATVIHVESTTRPDALRGFAPFWRGEPGADRSALYANTQANRLGLSLNLATEEGRAILRRLVRWADVLVESYSPGAMRRWGMEYPRLRQLKPDLIMLSSSLNGQTGPQASLAGFGSMGTQLAGFGAITGWPDRPPAGPFLAYSNYTAPKFVAASILAALRHRRRTGEGQHIDLSQIETALHFLTPTLLDYAVNANVATPVGNRSAWAAPHGVYPCQDEDAWVAIACESDDQWRALCDATEHPEWLEDTRFQGAAARVQEADALDVLVSEWTAARSPDEIESILQAAGVPVHRASTTADAFADPQLRHRRHFVTAEHATLGPVPIEATRFLLSRTPAVTPPRPGPPFGLDNETVLRDLLGMSGDEIVEATVAGALE